MQRACKETTSIDLTFVYFRLVNYQKAPVLDCRSVRPAATESEIPTGIEIRQSLGSHLTAFLVPVVKTIDKEVRQMNEAIIMSKNWSSF